MPPALEALLSCPGARIQGLLAPGHVCAVTGNRDYEPLGARYRIPIVVTGFEPLDLLHGVLATVRQLEAGTGRRMVEEVFAVADRKWRGLGEIPRSGLALAPKYARFDAERVFDVEGLGVSEPAECPHRPTRATGVLRDRGLRCHGRGPRRRRPSSRIADERAGMRISLAARRAARRYASARKAGAASA